MIEPSKALDIVLENISTKGTEIISIFGSGGRVMSGTTLSKRSLPAKDNSAMDGFAVKFSDIKTIPAKLVQVGIIAAGDFADYPPLKPGECYRIMTGAFMPAGADTVVEVEITETNDTIVTINEEKYQGANIRKCGEDINEGDNIDISGVKINAYNQSRLISTGNLLINAYRTLRIAVIGTGDELGYPDSTDVNRTIDSNSYLVKALFEAEGAKVDYLGIVEDDGAGLEEKLINATEYDLIVTSAGISFGDFDVVTNVTKKLNINWKFTAVNQKPGKPFSFGIIKNTPIIALPGNPVSAAFCAYFYGLPMIRKMQGLNTVENPSIDAITTDDMLKRNNRVHFNRVNVKYDSGKFLAYPFISQDSHVIGSLSDSNGFIFIPTDMIGKIEKGTELKVYIYNTESIFKK